MDDISIPVLYQGKEYLFPIRLIPYGYSHRVIVEIEGLEVVFEPDEERNYRALINEEQMAKGSKLEKGLLEAIIKQLDSL